ncbi:hypothetical protein BDI4_1080020 [Burkholderia diffusa]|nr:hypothetical protein BDI4_1080020 [Burkholderia diffusa]
MCQGGGNVEQLATLLNVVNVAFFLLSLSISLQMLLRMIAFENRKTLKRRANLRHEQILNQRWSWK